jgi:hypothetical protein
MELMERLMLAAINGKNNKLYTARTYIKYSLAGIAIIQLIEKNKLILDGEKIILRDSTPTGNKIADEVLNTIALSSSPRKIGYWITALQTKVRNMDMKVVYALEDNGYIRMDEKRFLGLFPIKQFTITNEKEKTENIYNIKTALMGGIVPIDEDSAILVAIVHACGFIKKFLTEEEIKTVKERLKNISKQKYYSFKSEETSKVLKAVSSAINNAKSASY